MPRRAMPVRFAALLRSRIAVAALVAAAALSVAMIVWPELRAAGWALATGEREPLRAWLDSLGPLAPLASIALAVSQAVVAPLPGFVVPYLNGVTFGIWPGALL